MQKKDYKKIIQYRRPYSRISTYNELIKELKKLKITPQESFDLAYKNKYQFNIRYYWTMTKIALYLKSRYHEFAYRLEDWSKPKKYKNVKWSDIPFKVREKINIEVEALGREKALENIDKATSLMSKRIDSCRDVVQSQEFKNEFKNFNPNMKLDVRKEAQTLHKLITEKKHRSKLYEGDITRAVNKAMKFHAIICSKYMKEFVGPFKDFINRFR